MRFGNRRVLLTQLHPCRPWLPSTIPLLKKTNLNTEDFKNFGLFSNFPFISKFIEKLVVAQLVHYIDDNNLDERLQSACKKLGSLSAAVQEALCKNSEKRKHVTPYIILQTDDTLYNMFLVEALPN